MRLRPRGEMDELEESIEPCGIPYEGRRGAGAVVV